MKTLNLVIIAFVLVLSSQLTYATTYGGHLGPMTVQMPFMKTNSTGTITIKYVVYYPHNDTFDTTFTVYDDKLQNPEPHTIKDFTINAEPKSINLLENNTVTYTIVAKNNIKGVYGIAPIFPCGRYPLVVGLNESEIMPSTLFRLSMPIHCGMIPSDAPVREIINYDGIILKNVTRTQDQFSPIEQIQLGSNSTDVQCKQGFDLLIKTHDNMPACVKSTSIQRLLGQGWINPYNYNGEHIGKESISLSAYQGVSSEAFYNNGTVTSDFTINVNINNFKPSNALLVLQVYYNDGTPYKTVTASSDLIQSDGFYKYHLIAVSDKNHPPPFKIVATYNDETVIAYAQVFAHP